MKAVIMAGGEGTRLRPLTCDIPKPMVPVVNRPMMEHIVALLRRHEMCQIANTLWYLPDQIRSYFQDGSDWQVQMEYFVEDKPLGTAGSVKNAQSFLDETFVVVSGDCLTDIDLTKAIAFHQQKGSAATIVLTRVANPLHYGVVITDDEHRITQFLEKPSWSQVFSDTVNTGIYILEPEVLDLFAPDEKYDFSQDLFPRLLAMEAPLFGYAASGYWSDVGNLEVYRQAQQDCLDGRVFVELPEQKETGLWLEDDVVIEDGARLEGPVYLGQGSRINAGAYLGPHTVVGSYSQVDAGASIKKSTLWSEVTIGERSEMRGTILAGHVAMDRYTKAYEGSVIGENVQVGARCTIAPDVKVWPSKRIPSGTKLQQTLIWGSQERPSLFSETGICGDVRSQLTPEMIVKVGLAYGGFAGDDNPVLVTADSSALARVMKRSLVAGLLSSGVDVLDGGTAAGNLTQFGAQLLDISGALHCQSVPDQQNKGNIQCWDAEGLWFSKSDQRKLENILAREDFPRASGDAIGHLSYVPDLSEQYLASVAQIYRDSLQGFSVVLEADDGGDPDFARLVERFLSRVGCNLAAQGAAVKVVIGDTGWGIEDEQGCVLTEDHWWALFLDSLKEREQDKVPVPVGVSRVVAQVAKRNQQEIQWIKSDPRSWMEVSSELGTTQIEPTSRREHYPHLESLVSIAEVLSLLSTTHQPLHALRPDSGSARLHKTIFCPWAEKGRVMRTLIHQADPGSSEFLDGIKYHEDQGWALVVPDGDEPLFRIYSEADTPEEADALATRYVEAIQAILPEEGVVH